MWLDFVSPPPLIMIVAFDWVLNIDTVQWVERRIKRPGTILTRVRFPGAARDFSPSANSLTFTVSAQPPCAIACINSCAHVEKFQTLAWDE